MYLISECFVILMFLSDHILKPSLQRMHASCMRAHYNTTLKTHSYAMRALALSTDLDRSDMTVRTRISVKLYHHFMLSILFYFSISFNFLMSDDVAAHRLGSADLTYGTVQKKKKNRSVR